MFTTIHHVIDALWIVMGIVWFAGALSTKQTVRHQSPSSRLLHISLGVLAFLLMFTHDLSYGPLARTFVPDTLRVMATGVGLTAAGIAFAIWARIFLGGNWSSTVTVKQDHALIRRGPYAIVRHPIYSGMLLGLVGTAIAFRQVQGLVAVLVALAAWKMKSQVEESFMMEAFGTEYALYRREVKGLIPFVW